MNRILAIPTSIGRSHLTRLVLVAEALREMGAEIAFAYRDPNELVLRNTDFQVFPVTDAVVTDFNSNVYAVFQPSLIEQCIQDELKAIKQFNPDLILADFRLTAAISARMARIPFVSIVNGCLTDHFDLMNATVHGNTHSMEGRFSKFVARYIQSCQKRTLVREFRKAAQRHNVKGLHSLHDFLTGDMTLIPDLPQLCPLVTLPDSLHFIGPLIWEGTSSSSKLLPDLDPHRHVIYATAGHTGHQKHLHDVVHAFKNDHRYQLVVTTGPFVNINAIPRADNVHVTRFIPGSEVLAHSHVVIHSGGSGTMYQALRSGVPALVIPHNNEQRINAWLLQKRGLGIALAPGRVTSERIQSAIERLISDLNIHTNVHEFQRDWPKTDGALVAAVRISRFLKNRDQQSKKEGAGDCAVAR